jgi:hypothetical protein
VRFSDPIDAGSDSQILSQLVEQAEEMKETIFQQNLMYVGPLAKLKLSAYSNELEKKLLWYLQTAVN